MPSMSSDALVPTVIVVETENVSVRDIYKVISHMDPMSDEPSMCCIVSVSTWKG